MHLSKKALAYAENCDNESGSFLTEHLIAIRAKAFQQGYQTKVKARIRKRKEQSLVNTRAKVKKLRKQNSELRAAYKMTLAEIKSVSKQLITTKAELNTALSKIDYLYTKVYGENP